MLRACARTLCTATVAVLYPRVTYSRGYMTTNVPSFPSFGAELRRYLEEMRVYAENRKRFLALMDSLRQPVPEKPLLHRVKTRSKVEKWMSVVPRRRL